MTESRHIASPWAIRLPVLLLALAFLSIPFSPSLNSLVIVIGLWCVIYPPLRKQVGFYVKQPAFFWGCAFYIWIVIRMIHDDPIVSNHLKLHYFLHYFNLFLPIFLLPPLFKQARHRLWIYSCVIFSGFCISVVVWASIWHLVPIDSCLFQKYLTIETEPMAVLYVFCAYICALLAYQYRTKATTLILCTLLLVWFTFIVVAVQTERVAVVLYIIALAYFLFSHFNKKISFVVTAVFIISAGIYLSLSHSTMHYRAVLAYQNTIHFFDKTTEKIAANTSVGARLYFYKSGAHLLKQKPLTGYGSGTFSGGVGTPKTTALDLQLTSHHMTAENNYLTLALQLGLIGLAIFAFYLFFLFKLAFKTKKMHQHIAVGLLLITCIASIDFPAFSYYIVALMMSGLLGVTLGSLEN